MYGDLGSYGDREKEVKEVWRCGVLLIEEKEAWCCGVQCCGEVRGEAESCNPEQG